MAVTHLSDAAREAGAESTAHTWGARAVPRAGSVALRRGAAPPAAGDDPWDRAGPGEVAVRLPG